MKEGTHLNNIDVTTAIRRNAELSHDWEYSEDAKFLYALAQRFRPLIDGVLRVDRLDMPDPIIGFDDARNSKVLAYYNIGKNAHGIPDEIIFNTAQYEEKDGKMVWKYGRWSQSETLLHEEVHLFLNYLSLVDGKKRPAHGKEFTEKCRTLGLYPVPNHGAHYQVADYDSPFGLVMQELGIERPDDVPRAPEDKLDWFRPKKEKGKSTLEKYSCACPHNIRVGEKNFPAPTCPECGEVYIRANKGDIYKSK